MDTLGEAGTAAPEDADEATGREEGATVIDCVDGAWPADLVIVSL